MSIIGTLPNNIQNGQAVDANPVMADFNFIVNQVNANANPVGTLTAPSGTRTVFHQASAPLGWTQDVTITDHTIQVIGAAGGATGGANGYSTMFQAQWTSDGHALTVPELAVHSHVDAGHGHNITDNGHSHAQQGNNTSGSQAGVSPSFVLQGQSAVTTSFTGITINVSNANIQNTGSGSAHSHTKTFNANYVAMIMAVKM